MEKVHGNFKRLYGKHWLKVFYHNISVGFFTKDECNETFSRSGKYNFLYKINELFLINDVYEFMIEYPKSYNFVWQQKYLPTNLTKETTDDVEGLKILKNKGDFTQFRGLSISKRDSSCFDADKREVGNYRFSIGTISHSSQAIPAAVFAGNKVTDSNEVYLWVRVPASIERMTCAVSSYRHPSIFLVSLLNFIS